MGRLAESKEGSIVVGGQSRKELLRKTALGGASVAAAAVFAGRSADLAQAADTSFVPRTEAQATDTFLPLVVRVPDNRPAGSTLGLYTGTTTFNGIVDPFVALGYFGGTGEGTSALQLEGDWKTGSATDHPRITELYWQIIKDDGATSRRPLYGRYDRSLGRMVQWQFMIGNGTDAAGKADPAFSVGWDDDTAPVGVNCFSITPNNLNLFPVATGGIAPSDTKLRVYSAPGKGSALKLSHNAGDPEDWATAYNLYTVGPGQVNVAVGGGFVGGWFKPGPTAAALQMTTGIVLGDGSATRGALWSATGVPANSLGNNKDWCLSDNGHLYFKSGGVWTRKL